MAAPGMYLLFSFAFISTIFKYWHIFNISKNNNNKTLEKGVLLEPTFYKFKICMSSLHYFVSRTTMIDILLLYLCFFNAKNNIQCTSSPCMATLTVHLCWNLLQHQQANAKNSAAYSHTHTYTLFMITFEQSIAVQQKTKKRTIKK